MRFRNLIWGSGENYCPRIDLIKMREKCRKTRSWLIYYPQESSSADLFYWHRTQEKTKENIILHTLILNLKETGLLNLERRNARSFKENGYSVTGSRVRKRFSEFLIRNLHCFAFLVFSQFCSKVLIFWN